MRKPLCAESLGPPVRFCLAASLWEASIAWSPGDSRPARGALISSERGCEETLTNLAASHICLPMFRPHTRGCFITLAQYARCTRQIKPMATFGLVLNVNFTYFTYISHHTDFLRPNLPAFAGCGLCRALRQSFLGPLRPPRLELRLPCPPLGAAGHQLAARRRGLDGCCHGLSSAT